MSIFNPFESGSSWGMPPGEYEVTAIDLFEVIGLFLVGLFSALLSPIGDTPGFTLLIGIALMVECYLIIYYYDV